MMFIKTNILNIKALMLFTLIIVHSVMNFAIAEKLDPQSSPIKSEFHQPHKVIEKYLGSVTRGELIIMDHKIDTSMIEPIRVDYSYELKNNTPSIKVYSKLVKPIPVLTMDDCQIHALSSTLDEDGHIIETSAHLWVKKKKDFGI